MSLPGLRNKKRLVWLLVIIGSLFFALFARLAYIQVIWAEELQQKAQKQWTSDLNVEARRGKILDRSGNVLAQNASAYNLLIIPGQVKAPDLIADNLSEMFGLDRTNVFERASNKKRSEVVIKRQLDKDQAQAVMDLQIEGLKLVESTKRYYPRENFLSQVIGMVSIDGAGQSGLELQYDSILQGSDGKIVAEYDARRQEIPNSVDEYVPPEDGYDITLTIDYVIQSFLEQALESAYDQYEPKSTQGIVMDTKTGAILAMSVKPDYDLNIPPRDDVTLLQSLSRNRVLTDAYEPGSTFKVITTAAALEEGLVQAEETFNDNGYIEVDGQRINCWRKGNPHGTQNLYEAVKNSCNPIFVTLALRLGRDLFYDYVYSFGFGRPTGIDYPGDSNGIVQPVKYMKNVDIARVGFGQSVAVTPLQLVTAISAVVNGGQLMQPYLVSEVRDSQGSLIQRNEPIVRRNVISADTSALMREILEYAVSANAQVEGYRIGGKTGTAQKYVDGKVMHDKHVSSFVGFAPADDPQITILIVVDEPNIAEGFGSVVAAPYAKQVLENTLQYLKIPPHVSAEPLPEIEIPEVIGLSFDDAAVVLAEAGLEYLSDGAGTVSEQIPPAGAVLKQGSYVLLKGSEAEEGDDGMVEVPDLVGMTVLEANARVTSLGLMMKVNGRGICVSQEPTAGTKLAWGDTVTITCEQPQPTSPPE